MTFIITDLFALYGLPGSLSIGYLHGPFAHQVSSRLKKAILTLKYMLTVQYQNIHRSFTDTSTVVNARGALNVYSFGYLRHKASRMVKMR